jgi:hypothetical protein
MGAAGRHRAMAPDPQTRHHQLIDLCKGYPSASIFQDIAVAQCQWTRPLPLAANTQ